MNIKAGDKIEYIGPPNFYIEEDGFNYQPEYHRSYTCTNIGSATCNADAGEYKIGDQLLGLSIKEIDHAPYCYDAKHWSKPRTMEEVMAEVDENVGELVEI